ncbi:MAG: DUF1573 domain-containing protein [Cryomorphaceae bacterium]
MLPAKHLSIAIFFFLSHLAVGQLVFNKTEHDFGIISKAASQFEQDFIFRNTGDQSANILSVRSVHPSLKFIYTRSEVLGGEYGFVKVKIYPDSLDGLFHDEVYITMKYGKEVKSEVLYLRAQIDPSGKSSDDRQFEDGAISTSVEVSPSDIETMEGFMGGDRLSQAESEISYLKKQVEMKSDLIAKLSGDLFKKQTQEKENFKRLASLEQTLKDNAAQGNSEALTQLQELTERLVAMRSSDSLLRSEITVQEAEYAQLKAEADSARAYAQNLSQQLQERFESEAKAMEKANQLAMDLKAKEATEKQQQAKIDSLNNVLALSGDDAAISKEIERMKSELSLRRKEQQLQEEHAAQQRARIDALKEENDYFKQSTDSLKAYVESSTDENARLQARLDASNRRIGNYESIIDSLRMQTANVEGAEQSSVDELQRLRQELASVEAQDRKLKLQISSKEQELSTLQEERDVAKKNMEALERATTKQQEHAQNLLLRINSLSSKESKAQLEINSLRTQLKQSEYREDSTRQSVNDLVAKISSGEASIQALSDEINDKEVELLTMREDKRKTERLLLDAQQRLNADDALIDSLTLALSAKSEGTSMLQNDIVTLQKQVIASKNREEDSKDRANELEARLQNAHLSNDLTFQELKGDVNAMRRERDEYKEKYKTSQKDIERLKDELLESKRNEESAIAFANELQVGNKTRPSKGLSAHRVSYSVHVMTSDQAVNMAIVFRGENAREYIEGGRYRYAIGDHATLKEAIQQKEVLKAKGYDLAFIVAFKEGQRISLKEAMETAQR